MEEAVRPCLRCDTLVEESRAYCQKCGNSMIAGVRLVVARPAAATARVDDAVAASIFRVALSACAALSAIAVFAAAWASLS